MEGVEAVRRIRAIDPHARVVVLTTYDADEDIARALQAGAKAYILKDIAADALVACIRDVLAGKTYLAPAAAAKLAERVTQVQLTPRELAALRLMANGSSNKEIAVALEDLRAHRQDPPRATCSRSSRSPAAPKPCASPPGAVWCDSTDPPDHSPGSTSAASASSDCCQPVRLSAGATPRGTLSCTASMRSCCSATGTSR